MQFLLSGLEVNGRQHAVVRVLALRVVEQLDVLKDLPSRVIACGIRPASDPFLFQLLEEALCDGVIVAISSPAHTGFQIVLTEKRLPLPAGELGLTDLSERRFRKAKAILIIAGLLMVHDKARKGTRHQTYRLRMPQAEALLESLKGRKSPGGGV